MTDVLLAAAAALTWVAATLRLRSLRGRAISPGQQSLLISLFALAVALTTEVPPVYLGLGTTTHVPNIAAPVGHVSVLVTAWAATVLLMHSTYAPMTAARRARQRLVVRLRDRDGRIVRGGRPT